MPQRTKFFRKRNHMSRTQSLVIQLETSRNAAKRRCLAHFALQMCFSPQRRAIFGHRNYQKWPESVVFSTFWLTNMLRATAACHFWTSQLPKWLRPCGVLCISTDQYASRHSGVPFWTSERPKWLRPCGVCAFWLANVLRATGAWHFSPSQLPKWLRECGVLRILTFKCAFRHSRVPFSPVRRTATSAPAALASLLFEHQEPRFIEKTQRFATFLTFFAHVELLASDSTRMLIFLLVTWLMLIFLLVTWLLCDSAFQLYILSEVRLLNFLRLYIYIFIYVRAYIYIYIYVTYRNRASFQVDFEHAFMVVCAWWDSHTCADFFFWRHFWALQKLLLLSRHGQQRRASFFSFEASYTNTWPCCIMLHVLFSAC